MSLLSRLAPQRAVLLRATASAASSSQPPSSPQSTSATSDTNHILKLPDGRTLGYALYGHPTGTPAFFFHGSPSCRLEGVDWNKAALNQGVRIIGVDRWGMGLSSFTPNVKLSDWPTDIQALATHLQLPRFHVFGGSGGGPYALACAAKLPKEVLLGTGVIAGVAPPEAGTKGMSWDRWVAFKLNIWLPSRVIKWMMDTALGNAARCGDDAAFAKQMDKLIATFSVEEQEVLRKDPEFKKNFAESFREACRAGCDGAVLDNKLILLPWDFQMSDVSGEVRIWNGTADVHVPVHAARWMAERLPNARLKEYEGESHLSLPLNYGEEILADLMAMGRGVDE